MWAFKRAVVTSSKNHKIISQRRLPAVQTWRLKMYLPVQASGSSVDVALLLTRRPYTHTHTHVQMTFHPTFIRPIHSLLLQFYYECYNIEIKRHCTKTTDFDQLAPFRFFTYHGVVHATCA